MSLHDQLSEAHAENDLARLVEQHGVRLVHRRRPPTCSDWWDDIAAGLAGNGGGRLIAILIAARTPEGQAAILVNAEDGPGRQIPVLARALTAHLVLAEGQDESGDEAWAVRADGLRFLPFQERSEPRAD